MLMINIPIPFLLHASLCSLWVHEAFLTWFWGFSFLYQPYSMFSNILWIQTSYDSIMYQYTVHWNFCFFSLLTLIYGAYLLSVLKDHPFPNFELLVHLPGQLLLEITTFYLKYFWNMPVYPLFFFGLASKTRDKCLFMRTCPTAPSWICPIRPKHCICPVIAPNHLSAG